MQKWWLLFGLASMHCVAKDGNMNIEQINQEAIALLRYNPEIEIIAHSNTDEITITCHGYGANKDIGHAVAGRLDTPILTFNFPDHDLDDTFNVHTSSFGTLEEFLPLLFMLKVCALHGFSKINLYGYSCGGGAIMNALALLHNPQHVHILTDLGISQGDVDTIKQALARGFIILETPLKSVTEILSIRPHEEAIQILAQRYSANGFEAIEVLDQLEGLKLNVLLYFEVPDEILSNRDDMLYYEKLKAVNSMGMVHLVLGSGEGHFGPHESLWSALEQLRS